MYSVLNMSRVHTNMIAMLMHTNQNTFSGPVRTSSLRPLVHVWKGPRFLWDAGLWPQQSNKAASRIKSNLKNKTDTNAKCQGEPGTPTSLEAQPRRRVEVREPEVPAMKEAAGQMARASKCDVYIL